MTSPTTVSVVITFFNASTFLAEALHSVVAQTYDGWEDQVFYAKVCLNSPVLVSDECLERYRQHAGSLCALSAQSDAETTWRRRYLHWLSRYVSDAGVVDSGLSRALRAQLWVWEEDRTRHLPRWTQRLVRTAKTTLVNVAALVPPSKTS
jgi:hypothetical protein